MLLPRHVISATTAVTLKRHIRDHIKASDLKQLNFTKDSENRTVVYTDGCCLFNNSTVEQRQSGLGVF
uniref:Uncharacterized protein n=2 Tax=Ciona intestinalis TaxID=7719 RepID=H2XJF5_CIOIN